MKDEIKEILINKLDAIEELNKNSATIMIGELKETILYITNLQEENERLKEYRESYRKELDFWKIQFSNLEDKIDKAIQYLYNCKKTIETNNDNEIEDYLVNASILLEILQGSDE